MSLEGAKFVDRISDRETVYGWRILRKYGCYTNLPVESVKGLQVRLVGMRENFDGTTFRQSRTQNFNIFMGV